MAYFSIMSSSVLYSRLLGGHLARPRLGQALQLGLHALPRISELFYL